MVFVRSAQNRWISNQLYIAEFEQQVTGIDELEHEHGFTLYPVPTGSVLNLKMGAGEECKRIRILSTGGKVLYDDLFQASIPVDQLSRGSYVIELEFMDGDLSRKIFTKL